MIEDEESSYAERFRSLKVVEVDGASVELEQWPSMLGGADPLGTGTTVWRGG